MGPIQWRQCRLCALGLLALGTGAGPLRAQVASSTPRADSTIRQLLTRLNTHDTSGLELPFDLGALAESGIPRDSVLRLLTNALDVGPIRDITLVAGTYLFPFGSSRVQENLTYHVVGARASRLVWVTAMTDSGRTRLADIRLDPAPADLRQMYPFSLRGRSWRQYAFLTAAILVLVFSLATAVVAVRTRVRARWLWALGSLVGFGKLSSVWVSGGAMRLALVNVQIPSATILKSPLYAPWVLSLAVPAVAIVFWLVPWRRSRRTPAPVPAAGAA